jgi:Flp pilus assembly protein TadD
VLAKKGAALLQLSNYPAAIGTLTTALTLAPSLDEARLCRAIAYVAMEQFASAREDYEQLLKRKVNEPTATFGLATIAWRKQETNSAIHFYQRFLSNGVPGSAQYVVASNRLAALKRGE